MVNCDRYWFLTWTTYGNWLPGDPRGFVSNVRVGSGPEVRHNIPGTDYDSNHPRLRDHVKSTLVGPPIRLSSEMADVAYRQFRETAIFREWELFALAIMSNHCHIVVGVSGDPDPETLIQGFKSYASRSLNETWSRPVSGSWWTVSGSYRKLPSDEAVLAAIRYVLEQEFPLVIWTATIPELNLIEGVKT